MNEKLVVVGASLGGLRAVEAARSIGHVGEIVLIGEELHFPPYDRPPMSKQLLLEETDPESIRLRWFAGEPEGVRTRLGVRATGLDTRTKSVRLSDGSQEPYHKLVIATGSRARMLPRQIAQAGVHTLRTFDDSQALRTALRRGTRVVIVGAGFIGCEVAATAVQLGCEVTVIDELEHPLQRACGNIVGELVRDLHERRGVRFLSSTRLAETLGKDRVSRVRLEDGSELDADVVVVGIGSRVNTEWLEGSGLELDDGVVCGQYLLADGHSDVAAIGDVCRWFNPQYRREMRVEHWTNTVEQAHAAVANLLSDAPTSFSSIPYVWSDQYGCKLQFLGVVADTYAVLDGGSGGGPSHAGVYVSDGRLMGAVMINRPELLGRLRKALKKNTPVEALQAQCRSIQKSQTLTN
jgi:NADPH-dependent 2,4-dienoyl-CoA reductase/sulfur reductase-like enzyme